MNVMVHNRRNPSASPTRTAPQYEPWIGHSVAQTFIIGPVAEPIRAVLNLPQYAGSMTVRSSPVSSATSDPDDEVFNKAGVRFTVRREPRSRSEKAVAWVVNLTSSLVAGGAEAPVPSQDRVIVVDRRTNEIVLKRGGTEVPAAETLSELQSDLATLSIRQFKTKWGPSG